MKRNMIVILVVLVLALVAVIPVAAGRGNETPGVIYVTSQDLYYDTFVVKDPLPMKGRFQELRPQENGPSHTDYGPGDPGYLGGRWWVDNPEAGIVGEMDPEDHYFLCPLLGPGRETP